MGNRPGALLPLLGATVLRQTGCMAIWPGKGGGGATGPTGPAGPTGATGPTGPSGVAGAAGATGPSGLSVTGATGPSGAAGPAGATGATGPAGSIGATGPAGAAGPAGPTGPAGGVGATGPAGGIGATGPTGPAGAVGATGPTGVGAAGAVGATGATGPSGPAGGVGATGATGVAATQEELDFFWREGLPEKFYPAVQLPAGFTGLTTYSPTAGKANYWRFQPRRKVTLRGVSVIVSTAAASNDETAVAVLAADRTTVLATSGAVAGKANVTGRVDYDFTADVVLDPANGPFYLAHQYNTLGGSAPVYQATNLVSNRTNEIGGVGVVGKYWILTATPTFPFATSPALSATTSLPIGMARER